MGLVAPLFQTARAYLPGCAACATPISRKRRGRLSLSYPVCIGRPEGTQNEHRSCSRPRATDSKPLALNRAAGRADVALPRGPDSLGHASPAQPAAKIPSSLLGTARPFSKLEPSPKLSKAKLHPVPKCDGSTKTDGWERIPTGRDGCPRFAKAYLGRKKWAEPFRRS
jgi:hypothetical protein